VPVSPQNGLCFGAYDRIIIPWYSQLETKTIYYSRYGINVQAYAGKKDFLSGCAVAEKSAKFGKCQVIYAKKL
jgi:hypothetical protein